MKKVILSLILLVFMPLSGFSQTEIPVSFDERTDLPGVVFRLAGQLKESFSWSEDHKTITVFLDLKPETHYSFSILGDYFIATDGYPTVGTHYISFTTRK